MCGLVAIAAVTLGALGGAHARSSIDNVTSIVAQRVSGGLAARSDEPAAVAAVMREVNAERGKSWQGYRGKLGPCAVRLTLFEQDRRVGRLVLDGNNLIELTGASESSGVARELFRSDLPALRRFAAKAQSASGCEH
jgi:hypothetical protein